eukprot:1082516-Rhodomonas_salina.1
MSWGRAGVCAGEARAACLPSETRRAVSSLHAAARPAEMLAGACGHAHKTCRDTRGKMALTRALVRRQRWQQRPRR